MKLNHCEFAGNAGKDCELKYMATGTPQGQFSLAVDSGYMKDNKWVEQTEWVNVVVWGDLAERVSQYITKGTGVYVSGKLQTRSWDDDKGVKHYRTEIIANNVQTYGKRESTGDGKPAQRPATKSAPRRGQEKPFSDPEDLPWE